MKTLISFAVYAVISGLLGLLVCSLLVWWAKKPKAAMFAALVFFGGPVLVYGYLEIKASRELAQFHEDVAYVKELCAKHGGDKIYKTVENVEGVFQMKARNPDRYKQVLDQFGMVEPWGYFHGDKDDPDIRLYETSEYGGYMYFEQQPGYGQPDGPPYSRTYLTWTGRRVVDTQPHYPNKHELVYLQKKSTVQTLRSQYGYITEDLSTPEMRARWIGSGRIKVIDLKTKEVLAERVGFFVNSLSKDWTGRGADSTDRACPTSGSLAEFLPKVLKPHRIRPTESQLESIKGE